MTRLIPLAAGFALGVTLSRPVAALLLAAFGEMCDRAQLGEGDL